jgi:hypothetical protein
MTKADVDVATYAVLGNAHLSAVARYDDGHPLLEQTAFELAPALKISFSSASTALKAMLTAHRVDWTQFIATLPPTSWVAELSGEIT